MSKPLFEVSVVMRRVQLVNRWVSEKWELAAVEPDVGAATISCVALGNDHWRWQGFTLDLHPSEAEGYYLNLSAPEPRVFVMWRLEEWNGIETARPWVTTASYHEAARMMDGGETVESVQLPAAIREWIEPWLALHYKPEPRKKHRRNQDFWGDKPAGAAGNAAPTGQVERNDAHQPTNSARSAEPADHQSPPQSQPPVDADRTSQ